RGRRRGAQRPIVVRGLEEQLQQCQLGVELGRQVDCRRLARRRARRLRHLRRQHHRSRGRRPTRLTFRLEEDEAHNNLIWYIPRLGYTMRGGSASSSPPTCSSVTVLMAFLLSRTTTSSLATVAARPDEAGGPPTSSSTSYG